jgi:hypothetical protein
MGLSRKELFRLPWHKTDNPGGWVEVTDRCDLACPGCYRHRLKGDRPLAEVLEDIAACQAATNCDGMSVAGGEPLLYPHILDVIEFIAAHGMKPIIHTNGTRLTLEMAARLRDAGLRRAYIHVDSGQDRPGWKGGSESDMNALRQHYADLLHDTGGVECGYNITVTRRTMAQVPDILSWVIRNPDRVHHLSLIAARAIPLAGNLVYFAGDRQLKPDQIPNSSAHCDDFNIMIPDLYALIENNFPQLTPCMYLAGTADPRTYKVVAILHVGGNGESYGSLGARTAELVQASHHILTGRYCAILKHQLGVFELTALAMFDRKARAVLNALLESVIRRPWQAFRRLGVQTLVLQQPREVLNGENNYCDGCMNMMMYKGRLVHSCSLDEYRLLGGQLTPVRLERASSQIPATPVLAKQSPPMSGERPCSMPPPLRTSRPPHQAAEPVPHRHS